MLWRIASTADTRVALFEGIHAEISTVISAITAAITTDSHDTQSRRGTCALPTMELEFVAEQEKRYADAADSDNNTKRDTDGTDRQRLKQYHSSQLFFGGAHRGKQTELLCSFRYGSENAL